MDDNFSPRVKDVITYSKEEALRLGHDFIGTEHLVLGLIRSGEGKAIEILNFLDVDLNVLRKKVESLNPVDFDDAKNVSNFGGISGNFWGLAFATQKSSNFDAPT